eukprot:scaffold9758_cov114-Skeletonema_menzelii.AAC.3
MSKSKIVLVTIPNQASSGQLCRCSAANTVRALHTIRTKDVVLAALPNGASSGQLCRCRAANTIAVRLSRRYFLPYYRGQV